MAITDRRVQKMNEILSYIKFIKMYAWVKAFSQDVRRMYSPDTYLRKEPFAMVMMMGMLFTLRYSRGGTSDPRAHRLLSEHHGGRGSNRCCHRQRGDILHPHVAGI